MLRLAEPDARETRAVHVVGATAPTTCTARVSRASGSASLLVKSGVSSSHGPGADPEIIGPPAGLNGRSNHLVRPLRPAGGPMISGSAVTGSGRNAGEFSFQQ